MKTFDQVDFTPLPDGVHGDVTVLTVEGVRSVLISLTDPERTDFDRCTFGGDSTIFTNGFSFNLLNCTDKPRVVEPEL